MRDAKSKSSSDQADLTQKFGPLEPFLILRRHDGSFSVAARDENGVIHLGALRAIPDPPKRKLISCPCCDRLIVLSEWPDGSLTVTPFKPRPGDGDGL